MLVWIGATAAFGVHVTIAVLAGRLLALLPHRWVEVVTAVLFAGGAAYLLFVPEKEQEAEGGGGGRARRPVGLRPVATAFAVIFVGEFGDLTQILTANLAAKYHQPLVGVRRGVRRAGHRWPPSGRSAAGRCCGSCPSA